VNPWSWFRTPTSPSAYAQVSARAYLSRNTKTPRHTIYDRPPLGSSAAASLIAVAVAS
jgi:hypothetical protein